MERDECVVQHNSVKFAKMSPVNVYRVVPKPAISSVERVTKKRFVYF